MKIIKSFLIATAMLGTADLVHAQELKTEPAKPPAVTSTQIQAPAENKIPAPALAKEKELAVKTPEQSSAVESKPVKGKDVAQPAAPVQPTLPTTTSLVPPNTIKNR